VRCSQRFIGRADANVRLTVNRTRLGTHSGRGIETSNIPPFSLTSRARRASLV